MQTLQATHEIPITRIMLDEESRRILYLPATATDCKMRTYEHVEDLQQLRTRYNELLKQPWMAEL